MDIGKRERELHESLLQWFSENKRKLPWRNSKATSYHRWLSEIMLQQTRVETVLPYFKNFTSTFPTVKDLAAADVDTIQSMWAGLGYYSRARNLHKCAQIVANDYKGRFPHVVSELQQLPGIGPYTAAAIASMAFDQSVAAIDGNLERVLARVIGLREIAKGNSEIHSIAEKIVSLGSAGKINEALMDLSSGLCKVKNPDCLLCPLAKNCHTRKTGEFSKIPAKAPKKAKQKLDGLGVLLLHNSGSKQEILISRRPKTAWLAGMWDLPWWIASEQEKAKKIPGKPIVQSKIKRTITNHEIQFSVEARTVQRKPTNAEIKKSFAGVATEFRWVEINSDEINLPRPSKKIVDKIIKLMP